MLAQLKVPMNGQNEAMKSRDRNLPFPNFFFSQAVAIYSFKKLSLTQLSCAELTVKVVA